MPNGHTYIRAARTQTVPEADLIVLANALASAPEELILSGRGALQGSRRLEGTGKAAAELARRNVRSLIVRSTSPTAVQAALRIALSAPPKEAEHALREAGIEFNLRYSLFATPDAVLRFEGDDLVITDGSLRSVRIAQTELREAGRAYFCPEALSRLIALDVAHVRFTPPAVAPRAMQLLPGALMEPDTAQAHLHKGDWRATCKPHFVKDYCLDCARCFVHCPDNAIRHAMFERTARDTTGVFGIDFDRCTACGICASVCPPDRHGYKAIVILAAHEVPSAEVHRVA